VVQAAARLATDQDHKETFGYLWSRHIPRVTQLLEEARRREELKPGVKPEEASWVWVAAYTGVDLMCRLDYQSLPRRVADLNMHLASGIATERTLAELDTRVERGRELLRCTRWAAEYLDRTTPRV
jgi:hypothetical protein